MRIETLRAEYADRAVGRMALLSAVDSIAFIERCASEGLVLLGVDGFHITEAGAFQPDQLHSNDIADTPLSQREFVERTKGLIREGLPNGIHYDVVVDYPKGVVRRLVSYFSRRLRSGKQRVPSNAA